MINIHSALEIFNEQMKFPSLHVIWIFLLNTDLIFFYKLSVKRKMSPNRRAQSRGGFWSVKCSIDFYFYCVMQQERIFAGRSHDTNTLSASAYVHKYIHRNIRYGAWAFLYSRRYLDRSLLGSSLFWYALASFPIVDLESASGLLQGCIIPNGPLPFQS